MNNLRIRKALASNMLKYWQLARILGISEMTLYRRLRDDLPESEQDRICQLIEDYAAKGGRNDGQARDN